MEKFHTNEAGLEEPGTKRKTKRAMYVSKLRRRLMRHVWMIRALIALTVVGILVFVVFALNLLFEGTRVGRYFSLGKHFLIASEESVNSFDGRTNILILGKAGEGNPAPELTDTIIFASVSHETGRVELVSLPRDIWIPDLRAKLNSTYFWGNDRQEGGGIVLAKSVVEEIVGQQVHYAMVVDFSGFRELIDIIGGIEVEVERGFVDDRFPIPGLEEADCEGDPEFLCRYETIEFGQGVQSMDGERALKFVRSRMSEDLTEGTDIARSARQQKVFSAIKSRVVSVDFMVSPGNVVGFFETFESITETDMGDKELATLARRVYEARNNINGVVLPEEFLANPSILPRYDNLYVFIPADESWEAVHKWVAELID